MAKTQKHLGQAGAAGRAVVVARGTADVIRRRHPSSADSTVGDRCAPFNGSSSGGGAVVAWAYENEGTEAQSEQARRQL